VSTSNCHLLKYIYVFLVVGFAYEILDSK